MTKKKPIEEHKPNGRPPKYKGEETNDLAYKFALLGGKDEIIAEFLGIGVSTLYDWKSKHPDFLEAIKQGGAQADAEIAQSLYQRAKGYTTKETKIATYEGQITDTLEVDKHYPPDTTAAVIWLKNRTGGKYRQSGTWADKQEVEHSGEMGVTFNMDFSSNSDSKES